LTDTIIGAILGLSGVVLGTLLSFLTLRSQIKIEKIKYFDISKKEAYLKLYNFISLAYNYYWPPENIQSDFVELMKKHFFKDIKTNYLYYNKKIREKIKILEIEYNCIFESDFIPMIPLKEFFKDQYLKLLNELSEMVENIFDKWDLK